MGVVNLADWAQSVGVNRHTAYRWFGEGTLPAPAVRVGRLILVRATPAGEGTAGGVVIDARVCSHDQRADLDRPAARLTGWATGQDLTAGRVVTGVGFEWHTPEVAPDRVGPGCEGRCCGASGSVGPFGGGGPASGVSGAGPPERGRRSG